MVVIGWIVLVFFGLFLLGVASIALLLVMFVVGAACSNRIFISSEESDE